VEFVQQLYENRNAFCESQFVDLFTSNLDRLYRLSWNISEFSNLSAVYVPSTDIWTPDIALDNKLVYNLSSHAIVLSLRPPNEVMFTLLLVCRIFIALGR